MLSKIHLFKKRDYAYLAVAASIIAGSFAIANARQAEQPLQNTMAAYLVAFDNKGQEVLQPTQSVEPGQTVQYNLTYRNNSQSPLSNIVAIGPVPESTTYLGKSAYTPPNTVMEVSIDGGNRFESEPVVRIITNANGQQVRKIIPPSEYTHLRWSMKQPLQAGQTQQFAYRSVVE